jgi:hypothetical protein
MNHQVTKDTKEREELGLTLAGDFPWCSWCVGGDNPFLSRPVTVPINPVPMSESGPACGPFQLKVSGPDMSLP